MKRLTCLTICATMIAMFLSIGVTFATAEDKILEAMIDTVTIAKDKNGAEYIRVIIKEDRMLSGVKYKASVPVMAFGDTVAEAKLLRQGQTLKAVVSAREYQGRLSYTIIQLL